MPAPLRRSLPSPARRRSNVFCAAQKLSWKPYPLAIQAIGTTATLLLRHDDGRLGMTTVDRGTPSGRCCAETNLGAETSYPGIKSRPRGALKAESSAYFWLSRDVSRWPALANLRCPCCPVASIVP